MLELAVCSALFRIHVLTHNMAPAWLREATDQAWFDWLESESLSNHQLKVEATDWGWGIFEQVIGSNYFHEAIRAEGGDVDEFIDRRNLANIYGINTGPVNGQNNTDTDGSNDIHTNGQSTEHDHGPSHDQSNGYTNGQSISPIDRTKQWEHQWEHQWPKQWRHQ